MVANPSAIWLTNFRLPGALYPESETAWKIPIKKTNDIFSKHEENYHKLGQQKSQNDPKSKSYRTKKSTSRALPLINKITNHHQANYKINTSNPPGTIKASKRLVSVNINKQIKGNKQQPAHR